MCSVPASGVAYANRGQIANVVVVSMSNEDVAQCAEFLNGERARQAAGIERNSAIDDNTRQPRFSRFGIVSAGEADSHGIKGARVLSTISARPLALRRGTGV